MTVSVTVSEPNSVDFTELPDLAAEELGGAALLCNDEFFAEKENLLKAHPAEWRDHVYTDRGKWMDGWESRRRREPGQSWDWCIIRLGLPGRIHGIIVDTAFFRGNFPESASIEGTELTEALDLTQLATATWTEILPRSTLAGDTKNRFAITSPARFTHLRLNIFPDGGVARLRVHGEVQPNWRRLHALGAIDLAALEHGAIVESCSDMFFGSRNNLIKPGPSRTMADGWETRRRRGPGNDWALIRLCAAGVVEKLEIDTTHFKGNAPGRSVVEGSDDGSSWRTILSTPLQPHTRHFFDDALRRVGPVTHLKLSVFPDGGIARFRAWGPLVVAPQPGLHKLNVLPPSEATAAFRRCCGSVSWATAMTAARPFEDEPALLRQGERIFWTLSEADRLEAFAAHPRIGSDRVPATGAAGWSAEEQKQVSAADAAVLTRLTDANQAYFNKLGFVFIVCATGRSAAAMLADLEARLENNRPEELRIAAEEQAKITRLRLQKLVGEL